MAFRIFKGLGQINRPSAADIRRRTHRVTNRIGLKPWTLPILLTVIKSLWLREQQFLEGGPVVMILTLLNQYIDAITHGILDILYSFTSAIPLLNTVIWPISLLLRLRIHLAPQKSFFGGILAPLKLGGCENVTSAVVAGAGAWWLYGNCRPFRRVVINIKKRGRRVLGALKRFDLAGIVKAVIMDPDAVAKNSNGFRR